MRGRLLSTSAAAAAIALTARLAVSQSAAPFGIDKRVEWTTSRLVGSPEPPRKYRLTRAFGQLSFKSPVFMAQDPTSDRFMVAEYNGLIQSFKPSDPAGAKSLFLRTSRRISAFSFHPKYAENGYVFVFSDIDPRIKNRKQPSRVSRFELERGSNPPRLKTESEKIIIEWPGGGHNGGEAIIGPDGYLYISTGDGTSGADVNNTGQSMDDVLAAMMRLDVDHPDPGRSYSIPKDNPFVNLPGARGEVWAYGFRNPWRFSFDPHTGRPWVGDVGQDLWEMIELSDKGANHGWSVMEGSHPFHPNAKRGPTPIVPPVVEHHHTEARSITGGYMYQGAKFPELRDVYLYGDYQYGKMWGLRYDYKAKKVTWHEELADTTVKMAGFAVARDGAFYAVDYDRGQIFELERTPPAAPLPPFPRKLSETGLFASVAKHEMAPGVIPYSINAAFWSDGAEKERFFAAPGNGKIKFDPAKAWEFDDGAVTVKSFTMELEEGNPASRKRIETRVVVKQDDRWVGYTYNWNEEQTDAALVAAGGEDRVLSIKERSGATRKQVWHYPSRNECMFCHSRAAGFVLGLNTQQMNRAHNYGVAADNQLRTLSHIGMFKTPLAKAPAEFGAFVDPLGKADLNARARTYLHVNCSICHVTDGGGNSAIDLAFKTPLDKARTLDEPPIHETFGIADARLIAPGDAKRSVIHYRMSKRGEGQMPPAGSNRVDEAGAKLLAEWINQLPRAQLPRATASR